MSHISSNKETGEQTSYDLTKAFFRPKLRVARPNDVWINSNRFFPSVSTIQRKCKHCEEEEKRLQLKEAPVSGEGASSSTPSYINNLSGGKVLSSAERSFFEPRMGYDFSSVRIHTDSSANQSARQINALAYTYGNNIVFAQNQYQPQTNEGKRLLAHELTHVIQQNEKINHTVQRQPDNKNLVSVPVTYEAEELIYAPSCPMPSDTQRSVSKGALVDVAGLNAFMLSLGDLSWLNKSTVSDVFSPELLGGLVPGNNMVTLDRIITFRGNHQNLLERLGPRIETEGPVWAARNFPDNIPAALGGGSAPINFTEAQLKQLPALVKRLNQRGIGALSADELLLLRRAAAIQGGLYGGSTAGSPLVSYSTQDQIAPFLNKEPNPGEIKFRVRVKVDRSAVLDLSQPNAFNAGEDALMNVEESEFLVVQNAQKEIISVQRMLPGTLEPGWIMRNAGKLKWGGRILMGAGLAISAYRIITASSNELPRVIGEEGGGIIGGASGTGMGTAACVALGVATEGVGLLLCGLAGGALGTFIGSAVGGEALDTAKEKLQEVGSKTAGGICSLYGYGCY